MLLCDSIPKVFYPLTIIGFCFNRFNFLLLICFAGKLC